MASERQRGPRNSRARPQDLPPGISGTKAKPANVPFAQLLIDVMSEDNMTAVELANKMRETRLVWGSGGVDNRIYDWRSGSCKPGTPIEREALQLAMRAHPNPIEILDNLQTMLSEQARHVWLETFAPIPDRVSQWNTAFPELIASPLPLGRKLTKGLQTLDGPELSVPSEVFSQIGPTSLSLLLRLVSEVEYKQQMLALGMQKSVSLVLIEQAQREGKIEACQNALVDALHEPNLEAYQQLHLLRQLVGTVHFQTAFEDSEIRQARRSIISGSDRESILAALKAVSWMPHKWKQDSADNFSSVMDSLIIMAACAGLRGMVGAHFIDLAVRSSEAGARGYYLKDAQYERLHTLLMGEDAGSIRSILLMRICGKRVLQSQWSEGFTGNAGAIDHYRLWAGYADGSQDRDSFSSIWVKYTELDGAVDGELGFIARALEYEQDVGVAFNAALMACRLGYWNDRLAEILSDAFLDDYTPKSVKKEILLYLRYFADPEQLDEFLFDIVASNDIADMLLNECAFLALIMSSDLEMLNALRAHFEQPHLRRRDAIDRMIAFTKESPILWGWQPTDEIN